MAENASTDLLWLEERGACRVSWATGVRRCVARALQDQIRSVDLAERLEAAAKEILGC